MIGQRKLLERLDRMLEDGINGTFEESAYDESELSRLEAKWYRYLTSSKLAYQKTMQEQNLDDESRKLVDEIRQQSEKLDFLIQSLVKTSRLESGIIQLVSVQKDFAPMVEAAIGQVRPKAAEKKMEISFDKRECTAKYDPKWTREAVFNLLDNAVKYSPEGSKIRVSLKEYELFSCISVSDQGRGITEEEQPLIFGRFYRGSEVREENGVGIGLYLTRQIIEGQGGYVTVCSEKGKGSTFEIYLPR